MPDQYPEIIIQFLASILIALLLIGFIVTIFLLYQKKKLVQEKEMGTLKTAFEKELLQTRLEIQEDVLKNISMEIHDNIGQIMLLANVNVSILQSLAMPPEAPALIKETKLLLSKAIEDISQLSRSLHSDRITEIGVFTAIKYELELLAEKGLYKITIEDTLSENEKFLPKETQLVLFRMFQEISKNIINHASASHINLLICKKDNGIEMQITDDGIGFDPGFVHNGGSLHNGVGMRSLRSRVSLIRGDISINSVLQEGTSIGIFIPVT